METDHSRYRPGSAAGTPIGRRRKRLLRSAAVVGSLLIASPTACAEADREEPGKVTARTLADTGAHRGGPEPVSAVKESRVPPRMLTRPVGEDVVPLFGLLVGTLVATADGCIAAVGAPGVDPTPVTWPDGWTARWMNGTAVVVDGAGKVFARAGDQVRLGGGGSTRFAEHPCVGEVVWEASAPLRHHRGDRSQQP